MMHPHGTEVWFFGAGMAYRLTSSGVEGRTMPLPVPKVAWTSPDGKLWVAGASCSNQPGHDTCGEAEPEVAAVAERLGASAYALAFEELWAQMHASVANPLRFDRILFATGSGGTQVGLIVGAKSCAYEGQILGISVAKTARDLGETVYQLLAPTASRLGLDRTFDTSDVAIHDGYLGGGYGVLTRAEEEAIRLVAELEGILLDPVYTGKAMAGLLDLIRRGEIDAGEKVLFWHTGGMPALFAHARDLMS